MSYLLSIDESQQIQLKIIDLFPSSESGIFKCNLNPSDFCMSQQQFFEETEEISRQKQLKNEDPQIFTKQDLTEMMTRSYLKSHITKNLKELLKHLKLEMLNIDMILNIVQPARPRVTRIDIYKMIVGKGMEYDPKRGLDIDQTIELLRSSFK